MSVYVHTTVESERAAEQATRELLDAGFPTRDIELIQRRGSKVHHTRMRNRSRVITGAGLGAALGAIIGSLAFTQPGLWGYDSPQLSISLAAGLGALFGLIAGGITGNGFLRTVPKFEEHPSEVAVGVHTEKSRVPQATAALRRLGTREVVAGTELDAVQRLTGASQVTQS